MPVSINANVFVFGPKLAPGNTDILIRVRAIVLKEFRVYLKWR